MIEIDGAVIKIHFPGWSPKHDVWMSLQSDWKNLAPINLLAGRQRETGGPLNSEQATATYHYLLTGALPPGIDIGESDSEYSVTSSDAGNSVSSRSNSRGNQRGENGLGMYSPVTNNLYFDGEAYPLLHIGLKVEVQDLFRTKLNEGVRAKWRVAEIIDISDNIVRIHFVGWDPKWDENIDITKDRNRIRDFTPHESQNKNKNESKIPKKVKEIRKSFNSYVSYPKQLTPVQEVSERSSPSISHSSSGVVFVEHNDTSEKQLLEQVSGALGSSSSCLDVVPEDANENFVSRRNSNKEKYGNNNYNANFATLTPITVNDQNYGNLSASTTSRKRTTETQSTASQSSSFSVDEKIKLACLVADEKFKKVIDAANAIENCNKNNNNNNIRSSFQSYRNNNNPNNSDNKTTRRSFNPTPQAAFKTEIEFKDKLQSIGLFVKRVTNDGNSLFRAVSHQMYLTESKHIDIRNLCVDHMVKHRNRFEMFCSINYDDHIRILAHQGTSGEDLEIRVLEEVFDRIFHVFTAESEIVGGSLIPPNINDDEQKLLTDIEPIRILNLGHGHYNSIIDDLEPFPLSERMSRILMLNRIEA